MGIKEAASKNKPRGRPKLYSDEFMEKMKDIVPAHLKTRRSIIDFTYQIKAFEVLENDERFKWLIDFKKDIWKTSILTEIGRLKNPEFMKEAALKICEAKPKTKDAVAWIRRIRTGKEPKADYLRLGIKILDVIETYINQHPSTNRQDVIKAIRLLDVWKEDIFKELDL